LFATGPGIVTGVVLSGMGTVTNSVVVNRSSERSVDVAAEGVLLANNTLFGKLRFRAAKANVTNQIVVGSGTCVMEEGLSDPASFQNNVLVSCDYADGYGEDQSRTLTGTDIDPALDTQPIRGTDETTRAGGNVYTTTAADVLFVLPPQPVDPFAIDLHDYWHLLLTDDPEGLAGAGKDTSASDCGSYEAPASCGAVTEDKRGAPRTVPYSPGAFEK
jgi:hypothetical protein